MTEKCNLRCKHCYTESKYLENELSTSEIFDVIDQYAKLTRLWDIPKKSNILTISGGEPFVRKDIFEILERACRYKKFLLPTVMTNGVLINENVVKKLKKIGIYSVQVSIDGMEETHDKIRGKGSFKKAVGALGMLSGKIPHLSASLVLSKENFGEIGEVAELCRGLGVDALRVPRLVPIGRSKESKKIIFTPRETREMYDKIHDINERLEKKGSKLRLTIGSEGSLWSIEKKDFPNYEFCSIGYHVIIVAPNGDVLPCRRLPIKVGNIREKSLFEVFYSSEKLWSIRNVNNINDTCKKCRHFDRCRSGARCVAYGYFKNEFAPDPQCWELFKSLPEENGFEKGSEKDEIALWPEYEKYVKNGDVVGRPVKRCTEITKKNMGKFLEEAKDKEKKNTVWVSFKTLIRSGELEKAVEFIREMQRNKINFSIAHPIPPCLLTFEERRIIKRTGAPKSCLECREIYSVNKDGKIEFCDVLDNRNKPDLRFFKNKMQVYEYFKVLISEKKQEEKCSGCIYFLRGECKGVPCMV